ncbi:IS701 family transposase, partial [bacterium]|nr:IS701 family transposase [bacterium]
GDPIPGAGVTAEKRGERLIRLSAPEVRKLLLKLIWAAVPPAEQVLAWSVRRRRHQHRARECHYKRRGARPPDG